MPGQRLRGRPFPLPRTIITSLAAVCLLTGAVACGTAAGKAAATPSASQSGTASGRQSGTASGRQSGSGISDCRNLGSCYGPQQLRAAYGILPLLDHGTDGRGETVVLLETAVPAPAPPAPAVTDIRQDLARFDSLFGLPAARLRVVSSPAGTAASWQAGPGEVRDAEIVHAVAPAAAIQVILAGPTVASQLAALRLGLAEGAVILISATVGEHCLTSAEIPVLNSALRAAQNRHVTVIGSTGEFGAVAMPCPGAGAGAGGTFTPVKGTDLPASDPLVLAVGGTSLLANRATGARVSETAWYAPPAALGVPESLASGGGFSQQFPRPAYQDGVAGIGASRGIPDVSADADPTLGTAIALSDGGQKYIVHPAGGTAAAAAFWAGLIALADQDAGHDLGFVNPAIYRIGRSPAYRAAFHDITTGTSTVKFPKTTITGYQATSGWDPVTGWGSPNARVLIPLLVRYG